MAADYRLKLGDRSLFPTLTAQAYLNHAAIAPLWAPGQAMLQRVMETYAASGSLAFPRWALSREQLKADLAHLIGAEADEIALGANTSRGVTDIALSLPWKRGDRVVVLRGEFPVNVTPWQRAAELFGLELCFLEANDFATELGLERLAVELARGVRLVAVSFVQFQTGLCMPLAAIGRACHAHGAELFVDTIQGLGVVPFDVRACEVDYLANGGHKWLLGTEGAGFLYVKSSLAPALRPYTAGGLSVEQPVDFLFGGEGLLRYDKPLRERADVFESGTYSLFSLAALSASIPLLLSLGIDNIFVHVQRYHDQLEAGMQRRGFQSLRAPAPAQRSAILSFVPPPGISVLKLAAALRERGVIPGTPDGKLRFAPHYANALSEVEVVLGAVDEALAALASAK